MTLPSQARRWAAAALLVGVGWLLSPSPVPVYDGISAPDEPYRFVDPPKGAKATSAPTSATSRTPVQGGLGTNGLNIATGETGPQFSLYLPPRSMQTTGSEVVVSAEPGAADVQPAGRTIDGNLYTVRFSAPVTLTDKAALATLYLRATSARQPGPVVEYRPRASDPWRELKTARGGMDIYVAQFAGAGQYALAFAPTAASGGGFPVVPVAITGGVVFLAVVLLLVRLRSTPE